MYMTSTCPFQKGGRRKRSVRRVSRKAKKSVRNSKRVSRKSRRTRRRHRGGQKITVDTKDIHKAISAFTNMK